jgi:glucose/arabinose dehydrogenase
MPAPAPRPIRRRRVLATSLATLVALGALAGLERDELRRWLVVVKTPVYRPTAAPRPAAPRSGLYGAVHFRRVASGLEKPTALEFVPGGRGLAIVLEQRGAARLVDLSHAGEEKPSPVQPGAVVLKLAVNADSEMGLLGLAFHPDWEKNGRIYVHSNPAGASLRTRISEWTLRKDELGRMPAHDERVLLEVPQPYGNHKGGQLAFGPDGRLYIGLGDGGWRYDPHGNGQNPNVLLGKILRLDVDARTAGAYGIPQDNPFVGRAGTRPEIWALGLRNPWRFSFDPHGRLVVGDVGQDRFEEIDLVHAGDNLGWNRREGTHCFEPKEGCSADGLVDPIFEYGRESGSCVTGGFVYTGSSIPDLDGQYVFGDFVSGVVWALKLPGPDLAAKGLVEARQLGRWPILLSSFGRDEAGEIYALDYGAGDVHRLAPGP